MLGEMKFLDIPDGDPLPRQWLDQIDDEAFEKLILKIEVAGPALAAMNGVDCKPISSEMWRLRHLIGFGKAHYLIFIAARGDNYLALHGFTDRASSIDPEAMAVAERRLQDLM